MNKRIQKKLEKRAEAEHVRELEGSAWGRITLSAERLEQAFDELVSTVGLEVRRLPQEVSAQLHARGVAAREQAAARVGEVATQLTGALDRLFGNGPTLGVRRS